MDSQESGKNIVVQVIGEISNKAAAHRKFVQAFVLAEQPKGYFVLNDIFRYIVEDEEEEVENEQPSKEETVPTMSAQVEPATLTNSGNSAQQQHDAEQVDKKLVEEVIQNPSPVITGTADTAPVDGFNSTATVEVNHAEDAPAAAITEIAETGAPEEAADTVAKEEESVQPEKPRDPDLTPVASPAKPTKAAQAAPAEASAPTAPPKPAAPKTWANLVAANRIAAPAVPNGASSATNTIPSAPQSKAGPSSTNQSITPPASANEEPPAKAQQNGNAGWQMAGSDNNKKQGRQHASSSSVSGNQDQVLGYVKNVTDKVDASILKSTLSQYGKLLYFDVSRPKVRFPYLACSLVTRH